MRYIVQGFEPLSQFVMRYELSGLLKSFVTGGEE